MRALVFPCLAMLTTASVGFAQDQPGALRGVYGPPRVDAACGQVRQVDFLLPGQRGYRQWSAHHDLPRSEPRSDAAERRPSRPHLRSARLRNGDRQWPSRDCRPQLQSHRSSPGLDADTAELRLAATFGEGLGVPRSSARPLVQPSQAKSPPLLIFCQLGCAMIDHP
jgi:hypothetical protein